MYTLLRVNSHTILQGHFIPANTLASSITGDCDRRQEKAVSLLVLHCCGRRDSIGGVLHAWGQAWVTATNRAYGSTRPTPLKCVVISHCTYHERFGRSTKNDLTEAFHTDIGLTLILFSEHLPKSLIKQREEEIRLHPKTAPCLLATVSPGDVVIRMVSRLLKRILEHGRDLVPEKSEIIHSPTFEGCAPCVPGWQYAS